MQVSGIDYSQIESIFSSTYTQLNKDYEELINVLNNTVIANYTELAEAIRKMFNQDFATKLNGILGLK